MLFIKYGCRCLPHSEGKWSGDQITFYVLIITDQTTVYQDVADYWNKNHPMENQKGYIARGRMPNHRTHADLMDLLDRVLNDRTMSYSC